MSLRERLLRYLAARPRVWVASGELQRLTMAHTDQTARTAVRRLQELHEDGELERELRKGHTWYRIRSKTTSILEGRDLMRENEKKLEFFDRYPLNVI